MPDPKPTPTASPPRRPKQSANIVAWLAGKGPDELGAIRRGSVILYPDAITWFDEKMEPHEDPILVRVPDKPDVLAGRVDAMRIVAAQVPKGFDFKVNTVSSAREFIGADQFEELENIAICARCMHDTTLPAEGVPGQYKLLDLLLKDHKPSSILDVWSRLDLIGKTTTPRFEVLEERDVWLAIEFMARTGNASPLAAMRASEQLDTLVLASRAAVTARAELTWLVHRHPELQAELELLVTDASS